MRSRALQLVIVEDSPVVARAALRFLEAQGHQVVCARSCAEALTLESRFDAGVIDIDLPDGNGMEERTHRRRRDHCRRQPEVKRHQRSLAGPEYEQHEQNPDHPGLRCTRQNPARLEHAMRLIQKPVGVESMLAASHAS